MAFALFANGISVKDVMLKKLVLNIITLALLIWPLAGWTAPQCSGIFVQNPEGVQETLISQLKDLRDTMKDLRAELKANKDKAHRLKALEKLEQDPRELAYVLQGAYRLLLEHPEAKEVLSKEERKVLATGLKEMKWLEKTLGNYSVSVDLYKTAKKIQVAPDFLAHLEQQRNQASEEAIRALEEHDFLDKEITGVKDPLKKLKELELASGYDHKQLIFESLSAEFDRVHEKVENEMKPLIMKKSYTDIELEDGAHAFRRSIRWLRLYMTAFSEYFYSAGNAPFSHEASSGKIEVDAKEYQSLESSIEELRKIKKPGEMREKMLHALVDYGFWNGVFVDEAAAADKIYPLLAGKFENIELKTQELLKRYEDHDGYRHLLKVAP